MMPADSFAVQAGEELRAADMTRGIEEQGKPHLLNHLIDKNADLDDGNSKLKGAGFAPRLKLPILILPIQ